LNEHDLLQRPVHLVEPFAIPWLLQALDERWFLPGNNELDAESLDLFGAKKFFFWSFSGVTITRK
jgi:hypothetical protein